MARGSGIRRIPLRRGDWVAIALGPTLVILIAVASYILAGPPALGARVNWGFGPDWKCISIGRGEPFCVKRSR